MMRRVADERTSRQAELVAFAAGGREDDAAEDAAGDPDEDRPMQPAPLTPVTPSQAPAMKPTTIHDSQL